MAEKSTHDKLKRLERAYREGRISEETYKELKAKYEKMLMGKTKPRQRKVKRFNLSDHIERLKKEGMLVEPSFRRVGTVPKKWKRKKWDPKFYALEIYHAILRGGFTYFRYKGEGQKGEVEIGMIPLLKDRKEIKIRERIPVLLEDESLERVGIIKSGWTGWWDIGTLYFTGKRFIYDTIAFKYLETGVMRIGTEVTPTLTMKSIWIRPDFSDLLSLVGLQGFYEEGTFKKKVYNEMAFEITGIKKKLLSGKIITSVHRIRGPGVEKKVEPEFQWWPMEEGMSAEELHKKVKQMVDGAEKTKIGDLIAHTYACHEAEDVWIATCYAMGPRRMCERPYALWGDVGMVVV